MNTVTDPIRLTQYSHGAGCGCKISPTLLDQILKSSTAEGGIFPGLIVGNDLRDDAAVFDLGNGTSIISTTDFFMPIVDDPETFGKIASVNAISDVYAMGGKPLMAIGILGWPINKLGPEIAAKVLDGARLVCKEAGIPLAGGHSIDSPEPIFGLAVTGQVATDAIKKNSDAKPGARLFLSKGLGVGVLSTAQKKGLLKDAHRHLGPDSMMRLNKIGEFLGTQESVLAMTDVTGFGLLGHLLEMCEGAKVSAIVEEEKVPLLHAEAIDDYIKAGAIPGGTLRNWESYGDKVSVLSERQRLLFCDPQTSGGLLIAVQADKADALVAECKERGCDLNEIGAIVEQSVDESQIISVI